MNYVKKTANLPNLETSLSINKEITTETKSIIQKNVYMKKKYGKFIIYKFSMLDIHLMLFFKIKQ